MKQRVIDYDELQGRAEFRFKGWAKKRWPKWDSAV
jgi:hypothetical protein